MTNAPPMFDYAAMVRELISDEREEWFVYDDATGLPIKPGSHVVGHPTIGIGRALDRQGIDKIESRMLLSNNLVNYVHELKVFSWWLALDPVRQRAVVNMRHQLGLNGLLEFHDMIAGLQAQDWAEAQRAGLDSDWARQTPERAERVTTVLRTGVNGLDGPKLDVLAQA